MSAQVKKKWINANDFSKSSDKFWWKSGTEAIFHSLGYVPL
jgi:hypothetical protein